ncbi:MAG TPA: DNA polymerase I [Patescibacteria group bacterium]|nr:DNA polymerase I [Patescibacteria group bacterium]
MAKNKNKLYVIDGNSLLHRAWHAIPPLTTKDGTVVNAVYGFSMAIDKIIAEMKPTHLVVCWDVIGGTFRDDVFKDYKAGRAEKAQELYDQIPIIDDILDAHGIPHFGIKGFEADDLLGTIAEHERQNPETETIIITGDLDALQLVDELTKVMVFVKGFSVTKVYDIAAVKERYGFGPEHIVDYKSLKGDSSDNIPGVKGIGDKGGTDLIQQFGTLEQIYAALDAGKLEDKVKPGTIKKLEADKDNALMSHELATIIRDVPMDFSMDDAAVEVPDWHGVKNIYRDLEFAGLIRRLEQRGIVTDAVEEPKKKSTKSFKTKLEVKLDRDGSLVKEMLSAFADKNALYAIDVHDHAMDLFGTSVTSMAISNGTTSYVFVSPTEATLKKLALFVRDASFVGHDLKRVFHILRQSGLELSENGMDLKVASFLVRAGSRNVDVDTVLADLVGTTVPDLPKTFTTDTAHETLGKIVAQFIPAEKELRDRLKESGMTKLYEEIEHPLIFVLADMESYGVLLDKSSLKKMSGELEIRITALTKKILKLAGKDFNIKSPSQLADVLFVDLELPVKGIKKTKTGYSTAAPELEKIREEHAIIDLVKEYRELTKLKSTYIDALPELVASDKRLHSDFNQTVAATGRLSSSNPNLQNIPIRTDLGRDIRRAFTAPKGKSLIAADYSQIELRLVAAFSGDKSMVEVFNEGGDIHRSTAAKVFDIKEEEVTKKQRSSAKAVNFGIIYGMGPRALSRGIGVSFSEAKEFIAKYFEVFPTVRTYLDKILVDAQENLYAESSFGRRRALPDLDSGVQMVRAAAERMATNMPLQGSAADIIKKAMIEVDEWLEKQGYGDKARMILQVHDELVFEVDDKLVDDVAENAQRIMENVVKCKVPLTVDVEIGKNWRDVK